MLQPEILLALLKQYASRADGPTILDAWSSYFDAHGVPPGNLLDRAAYHANLRGITPMEVWNGNIISPSISFVSPYPGYAFNADNITTLWQDVAGETPVTEPGQTVARIDDLSGQGNHATQSDPAKRPTYQLDANGRGYLDFDGVDDFLTMATLDLGTKTELSVVAAFQRDVVSNSILMESGSQFNTIDGGYTLLSQAAGLVSLGLNGSASGAGFSSATTSSTDPLIVSAVLDTAASVVADTIREGRLNQTGGLFPQSSVQVISLNLASAAHYIGSRAGASLFFNGKLYGLVLTATAPDETPNVSRITLENAFASILS